MVIEEIEYVDEDYVEDLLRRLRGSIFHLTTKKSFELIREDGFVLHNKERRFALNVASEKSFGRSRGWICLFDLRELSREDIEDTLDRYYFLDPSWFKQYEPDFTESNLAYLYLHPKAYAEIVPNETAMRVWQETKRYEHYVPKTECWYPGDMPLACVEKILLVRVYKSAPKDNTFLYAHHQLAVEEEKKRRSG